MPNLLIKLLEEERETITTTAVKQIDFETRIAAMTSKDLQDDTRPGRPSAFGCPDCGGVLWEIEEGGYTRYRCRVGHAYSPESMLGAIDDELEEALWFALKTLEESAKLSNRLALNEMERGNKWLVERFRDREGDARSRAEIIRRFLSDEPRRTYESEKVEEQ